MKIADSNLKCVDCRLTVGVVCSFKIWGALLTIQGLSSRWIGRSYHVLSCSRRRGSYKSIETVHSVGGYFIIDHRNRWLWCNNRHISWGDFCANSTRLPTSWNCYAKTTEGSSIGVGALIGENMVGPIYNWRLCVVIIENMMLYITPVYIP